VLAVLELAVVDKVMVMLPPPMLMVGVVLVVLEPGVVVTVPVPVPVVLPVVVVGVLGTGPGRLCETTDPTVSTPSDIPWSARFAASRLFGASVWICKPTFEVVPEDDPPDPLPVV